MAEKYTGGTVQRGIRVPEDLDQDIEARAKFLGVSYSDVVRMMLREGFAQFRYDDPSPLPIQTRVTTVSLADPGKRTKANGKHK